MHSNFTPAANFVHEARQRECELAQRLIKIAEAMIVSHTTNLSLEAIRQLPEEVREIRSRPRDEDAGVRLIDAEAACVVELLTALAYARDERDTMREKRMVMFLNSFIPFMSQALTRAM